MNDVYCLCATLGVSFSFLCMDNGGKETLVLYHTQTSGGCIKTDDACTSYGTSDIENALKFLK